MDLLKLQIASPVIAARTAAIRQAILTNSSNIRTGNFTALHIDDLRQLFTLYDDQFFGGWLQTELLAQTGTELRLRLSRTMTRAGGKTIRHQMRRPGGGVATGYEIAIASRMLFMSFDQALARPITACGLPCHDRLDALTRIFEHEMIHLAELLAYGRSNCSTEPFRSLVRNIFGHTATTHQLVTPTEQAAVLHGVRLGQQVSFHFEGQQHVGTVNRVNHRATVLVESPSGTPYSNGRRYLKFYIPLQLLKPTT
jgi:hypothetical protein